MDVGALLAPVVLYLLSHQWIHRSRAWRVPKEICIAALFGGGVAVFLVAPAPGVLGALAMPLGLFMLLCLANCSLISLWERDVDEVQGQTSLALQYQNSATITTFALWLLAGIATGLMIGAPAGPTRSVVACGLASSLLLAAVNGSHRRIGWQLSRVLADAALMTPLFPLAAGWLR